MQNADSLKGIQRGTSPSKAHDAAAKTSWGADHGGKTDPKAVLSEKYNGQPFDPTSVKGS